MFNLLLQVTVNYSTKLQYILQGKFSGCLHIEFMLLCQSVVVYVLTVVITGNVHWSNERCLFTLFSSTVFEVC